MIRVTGLRKHFGSAQILKGINFEVPPQTVLGIMGASGSGKSTLLRCLNGLETIDGGSIDCNGGKPYYIFQLQLTVRAGDDRINSLADCKNRVVGTLANTAASRLLEKEGIPFRSYADPVGAYRDLELKRLDAALFDVPAEAFYARPNPRLKQAGEPFTRGQYVIGLRKGDEALRDKLNEGIRKVYVDGTFDTLSAKYFTISVRADSLWK